jgi:hypothetical protein
MVISDTCEWSNPGADPYFGTAEAAIRAMAPLAPEVRGALLERVKHLAAFDDVIVVDAESIRGRAQDYEADLLWMNGGNGSKICATTTRKTWDPAHVETAIVFCTGSICAAKFSVCGNWAIVTVRRAPPPATPPWWPEITREALEVVPPAPVPAELPSAPAVYVEEGGSYGGGFFYAGGFDFGGGGGPCCICPPEISMPPAIPEPATWALMLLGIGCLIGLGRHFK